MPVVLLKLNVNRHLLNLIKFNSHHNNHYHPSHSYLLGQGGTLLALIFEVPNEVLGRETENPTLVSLKSSGQIPGQYH
jgi:hypothetical protein